MSKFLNTLFTILILLSLCSISYYIHQNNTLNNQINLLSSQLDRLHTQPTTAPTPTPTISPKLTLSSTKYGYQLSYPRIFQLFDETQSFVNLTYIPVCDPLVKHCLYLSKDNYPRTNFTGAGLGISILPKFKTQTSCLKQSLLKDNGLATLNYRQFHSYSSGGISAGNQYQDEHFFTFQNNTCYQLTLRITSTLTGLSAQDNTLLKDYLIGVANNIEFLSPTIPPTINITENQIITSPLIISGTVSSSWMYEGKFQIKLLDQDRNIISQTQATESIPGSWTSGQIIKFTATLNFDTTKQLGTISLVAENPSGFESKNDYFEIPIRFSQQQSQSTPPAGWIAHDYPRNGITLFTPNDWQSNIQDYPEIPSSLIRFWKKSSPAIVPIQLDIKTNWDNTFDARTVSSNFSVGGNKAAYRQDPPSKGTGQVNTYQTNVWFENGGHVYVFQCVHNWQPDYLSTCDTMLRTLKLSTQNQ